MHRSSAGVEPAQVCASRANRIVRRCCASVWGGIGVTLLHLHAQAPSAAAQTEVGARGLSMDVQPSGACASRAASICWCCCSVVWGGAGVTLLSLHVQAGCSTDEGGSAWTERRRITFGSLCKLSSQEAAGADALLCGLLERQYAHGLLMRCSACMRRRRRLQSRRKWERVDSAQRYNLQGARSQSLPMEEKSPVAALTEHPEEPQNLSSIYVATESAPASPFGSLQVRHREPLSNLLMCALPVWR